MLSFVRQQRSEKRAKAEDIESTLSNGAVKYDHVDSYEALMTKVMQ